jgi:serine/threonine protein kinase
VGLKQGSNEQPMLIDGFDNLRPIGRGASSQVFSATQQGFDREVALKVLTFGITDDQKRLAFENECRAMGPVSGHPNIVTVFGAGFTADRRPYLVMELCSGTLLDRIRTQGNLDINTVLDIGVQICGALQRSHDRGILHRDIKPQNIFFTRYGTPVLGDFGIASVGYQVSINQVDGLTLHYAAPEIVADEAPSISSDLYSLGATLYTALAGRRPFHRPGETADTAAVQNRILNETPPPIGQQVPTRLDQTIRGLLAKHPHDRPRSALELGEMLRELQLRQGLPQTSLAVAESEDEPTIGRELPTPGEPNVDRASRTGLAGLATVVKMRPARQRYRDDDIRRPSRMLIGVASLTAVVLVGGIGATLSLAGDDNPGQPERTTTTEPPSAQTVVDFLPAPGRPQNIVIEPLGDRIVVTWDEVDGAGSYLIERLDTSEVITASATSVDFTGAPGQICVTVTAVNADGRRGDSSGPTCGD